MTAASLFGKDGFAPGLYALPRHPAAEQALRHWEAGLLGHVLYLEAEAAGLRGTGIGCYFDDAVHELLGLGTAGFQSLYHFTVGRPLIDSRITSLPPYPGRGGSGIEAKIGSGTAACGYPLAPALQQHMDTPVAKAAAFMGNRFHAAPKHGIVRPD